MNKVICDFWQKDHRAEVKEKCFAESVTVIQINFTTWLHYYLFFLVNKMCHLFIINHANY